MRTNEHQKTCKQVSDLVPGPLYGLRVVDATDMRGAMCGRLLADLGADVLVLPNAMDYPGLPADSSEHRFRNANKRYLNLDITNPAHRSQLLEILEATDVFIENLGPKLQAEYGFTNLVEKDPNLIHISLSDFGLSGPHSEWRLEPLPAFSASGGHLASGYSDMAPCWLPGFLAHDCASVFGAAGAVAAVMDRRRSDKGQLVEISVQEASLSGLNPWSIIMEDYLEINPLLPAKGGRHGDASYWVMKAKDGWVRMVLGNSAQWRGFVEVVGRPDALEDPEWENLSFRLLNADVIRTITKDLMQDRTRAELFLEADKARTIIGPVHTAQEFIDHPQTKFREFFVETGWEGMESAAMPRAPWKLEKSPASLRHRAPLSSSISSPASDSVFGGWLDEEDINFCPITGLKLDNFTRDFKTRTATEERATTEESSGLLLQGIRIVEFGSAAVVPELCWMLSELGAEVIKVESMEHLDVLRSVGGDGVDTNFSFNAECRGRESVALNLNTEKGRHLAVELCLTADIVAENYRGDVLDGLGLSYEDLKSRHPSLIYISSQGYGRGGPMGNVAAFGPVNSAFAGTHSLWNYTEEELDGRQPCGTGLNHPDHIAGKLLSVAVLAAIDYRARTGEGQMIDMAQTEAGAYLMGEVYLEAGLNGGRSANGNRSLSIVPHDVYPCHSDEKGEDRWVSISAPTEETYKALLGVINQPLSENWSGVERLNHRQEIDAGISAWTQSRRAEEAVETLQNAGVSAMVVQGPQDHHTDPHLAERGFIVELNHPAVGKERHVGNPMRFSKTELRTAESSPRLGADTEEVLSRVLGLDPEKIQQLIEEKTCW